MGVFIGRLRRKYPRYFMNDGISFFPEITRFWHWDGNVFAYKYFRGTGFMLKSTMDQLYELELMK